MEENVAISSKATYNPMKNLPWGDVSTRTKQRMPKVFHCSIICSTARWFLSGFANGEGDRKAGEGDLLAVSSSSQISPAARGQLSSRRLIPLALTASVLGRFLPEVPTPISEPPPDIWALAVGQWEPAPWRPQRSQLWTLSSPGLSTVCGSPSSKSLGSFQANSSRLFPGARSNVCFLQLLIKGDLSKWRHVSCRVMAMSKAPLAETASNLGVLKHPIKKKQSPS